MSRERWTVYVSMNYLVEVRNLTDLPLRSFAPPTSKYELLSMSDPRFPVFLLRGGLFIARLRVRYEGILELWKRLESCRWAITGDSPARAN